MNICWTIILFAVCLVVGPFIGCQPTDKTITLDLRSTHHGELFYSQLTTGQDGHEQTFNMLVSTSYPVTYIPSADIDPVRGYRPGPNVQVGGQLSYLRTTGANYGTDPYYINYDRVKLGAQVVVDRQPIGVLDANKHHKGMVANIDGMLGLEYGAETVEDVNYPLENLHKLKHIDHLKYSLYINNTAVANRLNSNNITITDLSQPEGALVLGGIDARFFIGDFKYAKLKLDNIHHSRTDRSMFITRIRLDWSRADVNRLSDSIARLGTIDIDIAPKILKLDSSLILFVGDKLTLDNIHLDIIGAYPIIRKSFYVFKDCRLDNKPDLVFTLKDGLDVTITPEDYVIEHELHGRKVCLSGFKPSGGDAWSFGTRFMRKYYILFDPENGRVGFAKPT